MKFISLYIKGAKCSFLKTDTSKVSFSLASVTDYKGFLILMTLQEIRLSSLLVQLPRSINCSISAPLIPISHEIFNFYHNPKSIIISKVILLFYSTMYHQEMVIQGWMHGWNAVLQQWQIMKKQMEMVQMDLEST